MPEVLQPQLHRATQVKFHWTSFASSLMTCLSNQKDFKMTFTSRYVFNVNSECSLKPCNFSCLCGLQAGSPKPGTPIRLSEPNFMKQESTTKLPYTTYQTLNLLSCNCWILNTRLLTPTNLGPKRGSRGGEQSEVGCDSQTTTPFFGSFPAWSP